MTFDFACRCELSTTPRVITSQLTFLFDVEFQTLSEYHMEILHIWFVTFQSMDLKLWHDLRCTAFGLIDDKDLDECIDILLHYQKENQMNYLKLLWLSTAIDYFDSSPLAHKIDVFLWPHIQNQSMKELYGCHQILPPDVESNVINFIKKNDLISSTIRSVGSFHIKICEPKNANFCVFLIVFIQHVSYTLAFHTQYSLEAWLSNGKSIILVYIKLTSVEAAKCLTAQTSFHLRGDENICTVLRNHFELTKFQMSMKDEWHTKMKTMTWGYHWWKKRSPNSSYKYTLDSLKTLMTLMGDLNCWLWLLCLFVGEKWKWWVKKCEKVKKWEMNGTRRWPIWYKEANKGKQ